MALIPKRFARNQKRACSRELETLVGQLVTALCAVTVVRTAGGERPAKRARAASQTLLGAIPVSAVLSSAASSSEVPSSSASGTSSSDSADESSDGWDMEAPPPMADRVPVRQRRKRPRPAT